MQISLLKTIVLLILVDLGHSINENDKSIELNKNLNEDKTELKELSNIKKKFSSGYGYDDDEDDQGGVYDSDSARRQTKNNQGYNSYEEENSKPPNFDGIDKNEDVSGGDPPRKLSPSFNWNDKGKGSNKEEQRIKQNEDWFQKPRLPEIPDNLGTFEENNDLESNVATLPPLGPSSLIRKPSLHHIGFGDDEDDDPLLPNMNIRPNNPFQQNFPGSDFIDESLPGPIGVGNNPYPNFERPIIDPRPFDDFRPVDQFHPAPIPNQDLGLKPIKNNGRQKRPNLPKEPKRMVTTTERPLNEEESLTLPVIETDYELDDETIDSMNAQNIVSPLPTQNQNGDHQPHRPKRPVRPQRPMKEAPPNRPSNTNHVHNSRPTRPKPVIHKVTVYPKRPNYSGENILPDITNLDEEQPLPHPTPDQSTIQTSISPTTDQTTTTQPTLQTELNTNHSTSQITSTNRQTTTIPSQTQEPTSVDSTSTKSTERITEKSVKFNDDFIPITIKPIIDIKPIKMMTTQTERLTFLTTEATTPMTTIVTKTTARVRGAEEHHKPQYKPKEWKPITAPSLVVPNIDTSMLTTKSWINSEVNPTRNRLPELTTRRRLFPEKTTTKSISETTPKLVVNPSKKRIIKTKTTPEKSFETTSSTTSESPRSSKAVKKVTRIRIAATTTTTTRKPRVRKTTEVRPTSTFKPTRAKRTRTTSTIAGTEPQTTEQRVTPTPKTTKRSTKKLLKPISVTTVESSAVPSTTASVPRKHRIKTTKSVNSETSSTESMSALSEVTPNPSSIGTTPKSLQNKTRPTSVTRKPTPKPIPIRKRITKILKITTESILSTHTAINTTENEPVSTTGTSSTKRKIKIKRPISSKTTMGTTVPNESSPEITAKPQRPAPVTKKTVTTGKRKVTKTTITPVIIETTGQSEEVEPLTHESVVPQNSTQTSKPTPKPTKASSVTQTVKSNKIKATQKGKASTVKSAQNNTRPTKLVIKPTKRSIKTTQMTTTTEDSSSPGMTTIEAIETSTPRKIMRSSPPVSTPSKATTISKSTKKTNTSAKTTALPLTTEISKSSPTERLTTQIAPRTTDQGKSPKQSNTTTHRPRPQMKTTLTSSQTITVPSMATTNGVTTQTVKQKDSSKSTPKLINVSPILTTVPAFTSTKHNEPKTTVHSVTKPSVERTTIGSLKFETKSTGTSTEVKTTSKPNLKTTAKKNPISTPNMVTTTRRPSSQSPETTTNQNQSSKATLKPVVSTDSMTEPVINTLNTSKVGTTSKMSIPERMTTKHGITTQSNAKTGVVSTKPTITESEVVSIPTKSSLPLTTVPSKSKTNPPMSTTSKASNISKSTPKTITSAKTTAQPLNTVPTTPKSGLTSVTKKQSLSKQTPTLQTTEIITEKSSNPSIIDSSKQSMIATPKGDTTKAVEQKNTQKDIHKLNDLSPNPTLPPLIPETTTTSALTGTVTKLNDESVVLSSTQKSIGSTPQITESEDTTPTLSETITPISSANESTLGEQPSEEHKKGFPWIPVKWTFRPPKTIIPVNGPISTASTTTTTPSTTTTRKATTVTRGRPIWKPVRPSGRPYKTTMKPTESTTQFSEASTLSNWVTVPGMVSVITVPTLSSTLTTNEAQNMTEIGSSSTSPVITSEPIETTVTTLTTNQIIADTTEQNTSDGSVKPVIAIIVTQTQETQTTEELTTETPTEASTEKQTEGQTEASTEAQTEAHVEEQTEGQTEEQTEGQTEPQTEGQTEPPIETQTEGQTEPQTEAQTEPPIETQTEEQTKAPTEEPSQVSTDLSSTEESIESTEGLSPQSETELSDEPTVQTTEPITGIEEIQTQSETLITTEESEGLTDMSTILDNTIMESSSSDTTISSTESEESPGSISDTHPIAVSIKPVISLPITQTSDNNTTEEDTTINTVTNDVSMTSTEETISADIGESDHGANIIETGATEVITDTPQSEGEPNSTEDVITETEVLFTETNSFQTEVSPEDDQITAQMSDTTSAQNTPQTESESVNIETQTEPQTEGQTEKQTEPQTEAQTGAPIEEQTEAQTEEQTEPQTEPQTEGQTEGQTEEQTESQTEAQTESQTEEQTESQTESQTEGQTEGQTEEQTESQTEPQTEGQIEPQTEAQTEGQTEEQTESQTEAQTESQTEEQTESQTEPQTEGQTEEQNEFQTEAQTEPPIEVQTEAQTEGLTEGSNDTPNEDLTEESSEVNTDMDQTSPQTSSDKTGTETTQESDFESESSSQTPVPIEEVTTLEESTVEELHNDIPSTSFEQNEPSSSEEIQIETTTEELDTESQEITTKELELTEGTTINDPGSSAAEEDNSESIETTSSGVDTESVPMEKTTNSLEDLNSTEEEMTESIISNESTSIDNESINESIAPEVDIPEETVVLVESSSFSTIESEALPTEETTQSIEEISSSAEEMTESTERETTSSSAVETESVPSEETTDSLEEIISSSEETTLTEETLNESTVGMDVTTGLQIEGIEETLPTEEDNQTTPSAEVILTEETTTEPDSIAPETTKGEEILYPDDNTLEELVTENELDTSSELLSTGSAIANENQPANEQGENILDEETNVPELESEETPVTDDIEPPIEEGLTESEASSSNEEGTGSFTESNYHDHNDETEIESTHADSEEELDNITEDITAVINDETSINEQGDHETNVESVENDQDEVKEVSPSSITDVLEGEIQTIAMTEESVTNEPEYEYIDEEVSNQTITSSEEPEYEFVNEVEPTPNEESVIIGEISEEIPIDELKTDDLVPTNELEAELDEGAKEEELSDQDTSSEIILEGGVSETDSLSDDQDQLTDDNASDEPIENEKNDQGDYDQGEQTGHSLEDENITDNTNGEEVPNTGSDETENHESNDDNSNEEIVEGEIKIEQEQTDIPTVKEEAEDYINSSSDQANSGNDESQPDNSDDNNLTEEPGINEQNDLGNNENNDIEKETLNNFSEDSTQSSLNEINENLVISDNQDTNKEHGQSLAPVDQDDTTNTEPLTDQDHSHETIIVDSNSSADSDYIFQEQTTDDTDPFEFSDDPAQSSKWTELLPQLKTTYQTIVTQEEVKNDSNETNSNNSNKAETSGLILSEVTPEFINDTSTINAENDTSTINAENDTGTINAENDLDQNTTIQSQTETLKTISSVIFPNKIESINEQGQKNEGKNLDDQDKDQNNTSNEPSNNSISHSDNQSFTQTIDSSSENTSDLNHSSEMTENSSAQNKEPGSSETITESKETDIFNEKLSMITGSVYLSTENSRLISSEGSASEEGVFTRHITTSSETLNVESESPSIKDQDHSTPSYVMDIQTESPETQTLTELSQNSTNIIENSSEQQLTSSNSNLIELSSTVDQNEELSSSSSFENSLGSNTEVSKTTEDVVKAGHVIKEEITQQSVQNWRPIEINFTLKPIDLQEPNKTYTTLDTTEEYLSETKEPLKYTLKDLSTEEMIITTVPPIVETIKTDVNDQLDQTKIGTGSSTTSPMMTIHTKDNNKGQNGFTTTERQSDETTIKSFTIWRKTKYPLISTKDVTTHPSTDVTTQPIVTFESESTTTNRRGRRTRFPNIFQTTELPLILNDNHNLFRPIDKSSTEPPIGTVVEGNDITSEPNTVSAMIGPIGPNDERVNKDSTSTNPWMSSTVYPHFSKKTTTKRWKLNGSKRPELKLPKLPSTISMKDFFKRFPTIRPYRENTIRPLFHPWLIPIKSNDKDHLAQARTDDKNFIGPKLPDFRQNEQDHSKLTRNLKQT